MMRWRLTELAGEYQAATGKVISQEMIRRETGLALATISDIANNKTGGAKLETIERLLEFFSRRLGRELGTGDLLRYTPDPQTAGRVVKVGTLNGA